jgi:hypothetical protein
MEKSRRKNLLREYKERKQAPGIFAVRCTATGGAWVASSRNLDTQRNGIWFQLQQGGYPNKTLQAAWNAHGEDAFVYEVLENVTDDNPLLIGSLLKERAIHWREKLSAAPLIG